MYLLVSLSAAIRVEFCTSVLLSLTSFIVQLENPVTGFLCHGYEFIAFGDTKSLKKAVIMGITCFPSLMRMIPEIYLYRQIKIAR